MHTSLANGRGLSSLQALAGRARTSARHKRLLYWLGALLWIMALEAGATFSAVPVATLIPVSFPILAWIKGRMESGVDFQTWCNAHLCAEIVRILSAFDACGIDPAPFVSQLRQRVSEFRLAPPDMIARLLNRPNRTPVLLRADALRMLRAGLIDVPYDRLHRTMPQREKQVRNLRYIAGFSYTSAILLAVAGIGASLLGRPALGNWHGFLVYALPAVASVIGIFFSDAADASDIAKDRYLLVRHELTRTRLELTRNVEEQVALFNMLAYEEIVDVIEWWHRRVR
jgi:hypothetical protein